MSKEQLSEQPRATLSRRFPLMVLLITVCVFDLIAITSVSSLHSNIIASILAISYTQTLLSAVWLANGYGRLGARLLVALVFLMAAVVTTTIYLVRAIGWIFPPQNFASAADWLVSVTVVFVVGLLSHWALCMTVLVPMRFLGWQLVPHPDANQSRPTDSQFGIRTILVWTAITAVAIASLRGAWMLADWRLDQFQWNHMLLSVTYSIFFVLLHLLITFGLLAGRRFRLRYFVVLACCGFLTWIEIEAIDFGFPEAESGEFVVLNAYLVAFASALALAARYAGLRMARRMARPVSV